ncbi:MAG TPA: hypothetical protein IGS52_25255 [Oscillatoriaceae cyanobacterium M33_DOE_052]|uniref:Uncharacterized protein n=1 Tax=Planktothricoides sp. SpSt-374 TaxID=2282167 RepID=A0A7C3VJV8_9CYAN|nr:hypothetical protein [Oscillatoriaceae cyanobacterium M33_DOE_052]
MKAFQSYRESSYQESKHRLLLHHLKSELRDFDRLWGDHAAIGLVEALKLLESEVNFELNRLEETLHYFN